MFPVKTGVASGFIIDNIRTQNWRRWCGRLGQEKGREYLVVKYPSRVWRINWRVRDLISFCLLVIIVETKDLIKATSGQKDLLWFMVAGCSLTWWQEHEATNHIASVIRSREP